MRKRIQRKLRSRTGASITFALLLFLVCAVLCSVIIAAATAASGRMSQIAETDQRYYAVTSAAELLTNLIEGKTVTVVDRTETVCATKYSEGTVVGSTEDTPTVTRFLVPDRKMGEISEAEDLVSANQVTDSTLTYDTIQAYAAMCVVNGETLDKRRLSIHTNQDYSPLDVTVEEDLDAQGNITLTVYNTWKAENTPSAAGDRYTLVLRFGADRSETTGTRTENISSTVTGDGKYTVTTKKIETKFTTMTWNLIGIEPPGEA